MSNDQDKIALAAAVAVAAVYAARERVKGRVRETPLERASWLEQDGSQVFLKLENEQVTGSFKARGAVNKLVALWERNELGRGVVTASTGNHALATAYACSIVEPTSRIDYQIVLPVGASSAKVDHLRAVGAPLRFHGADCLEAELEAMQIARVSGATYISPYNDVEIIGGQGTAGLEIMEQFSQTQVNISRKSHKLDAVFVPVGGGGLISGVAAAIKSASPTTRIFGCCPANDAHMGLSVQAGRLLTAADNYLKDDGMTISEGTAGAVETGSVTFPLCQSLVDEWVMLGEEEIGQAVVQILDKHHKAVEGAAGLGVAAYLRKRNELKGKTVAIVLCGGNVKATMVRELLNRHLGGNSN